ncbi:MAG: sodium-dependent bicarbonate transport family permease [Planctomycetota bacterium]
MSLDLVLSNLLTPPILFFALGMVAAVIRSDLEIPAAVTKPRAL